MRPHHGEEFSLAELNPIEWQIGTTPQVRNEPTLRCVPSVLPFIFTMIILGLSKTLMTEKFGVFTKCICGAAQKLFSRRRFQVPCLNLEALALFFGCLKILHADSLWTARDRKNGPESNILKETDLRRTKNHTMAIPLVVVSLDLELLS